MFKGNFFKKHELDTLEEEARKFQSHGKYTEAAENYTKLAEAYLEENPLIYARYCHDTFRMWLKAKDAGKAMDQAQTVFHVLDDTGWLNRSMEQVLDIKLMIEELHTAGFSIEADSFAQKLNEKLAEFGLMLKPSPHGDLPANCPSCGARLPQSAVGDEITCSFCGYVVRRN